MTKMADSELALVGTIQVEGTCTDQGNDVYTGLTEYSPTSCFSFVFDYLQVCDRFCTAGHCSMVCPSWQHCSYQ